MQLLHTAGAESRHGLSLIMLAAAFYGERFTPMGFLGIALLGGSLLLLYLGAPAPLRRKGDYEPRGRA